MAKFGTRVPRRRVLRPTDPVVGQLHWLQLDVDYGMPCGTALCVGRTVVLRYSDHWRPLCLPCLDTQYTHSRICSFDPSPPS